MDQPDLGLTHFIHDALVNFAVHQTTGIPFDREEQDFYELIVEARREHDHQHVARVLVKVHIEDINDNAPVFVGLPYYAAVQVEAESGLSIFKVSAVDGDKGINGEVTYFLKDDHGHFMIDQQTGTITTNYLTGSHAEVDVDVLVQDINDNPPVFKEMSYRIVLSETVMIGTPALQVIATDMDSEKNNVVGYQIFSKEHNSTDYFHIDSSSGLILTARILDHELVPEYDFIVRATDNGFPSLSTEVSVTVLLKDMNDNPPVFNQLLYEAYVSELAPKGHFITCVQASDADSSDFDKLVYSILSGNERMDFVMERKTGIIMLSSHLKQRMEPTYNLNVSVSDGVFTSTAQVHVKVFGANLHDPVFEQKMFEAELRENSPVGTNVIQVGAFEIH
uniref:Cadherin domain-containing protein n=1 Tax=Xiphophorus couchianus TaxID=32473 RepID=A0A3B5L838_9TELE